MKKSSLQVIMFAVAGVGSLLVQQTCAAATYTWAGPLTGDTTWFASANWSSPDSGATYPNTAGDVVNLQGNFTGTTNVRTQGGTAGTMVVGTLNWNPAGFTANIGKNNGETPAITFDNGSGTDVHINHTSGITGDVNLKSSAILKGNLIVNVGSGLTIHSWGAITESGGSYGITKQGAGVLRMAAINGNSTYSGLSTIEAGTLRVDPAASAPFYNAITGNIRVKAGTLQNGGANCIADTSNIEFQGGTWNMGGNSETIGSLTSASGVGTIQNGGTLTLAASSGTTSYGGVINVGGTGVALAKTGGSTQTLAGTGANVLTSVSVTGGILQLNKAVGVNALSGAITLGTGGTIRLLASDQIANASTLALSGGTLDTNGYSEQLATLTNGGGSIIDMGAGTSTLTFANSSAQTWSGTIQILNWSGLPTGGGTDQLTFGASGLSAAQVAMISFVNPNPTIWGPGTYGATVLPSGEIVAVPEPAILGTLVASSLLFLRRRRQA